MGTLHTLFTQMYTCATEPLPFSHAACVQAVSSARVMWQRHLFMCMFACLYHSADTVLCELCMLCNVLIVEALDEFVGCSPSCRHYGCSPSCRHYVYLSI